MKQENKKKSKYLLLLYSGIALASLLVATIVFSWIYLKQYQSTFLPGVVIAGTEVGGFSSLEAANLVFASTDLWNQKPLTFYYEDKTYSLAMTDVLTDKACKEQIEAIWQTEQKRSAFNNIISLLTQKKMTYSLALDESSEPLQNTSANWQSDWNREAQNATITFDAEGFVVEPEQVGLAVDIEATLAQLPPALDQASGQKYELVMQKSQPAITADDFKNLGEITSYSTNYNPGEVSRTHNLMQAVAKVDGIVLEPGEEFSFNRRVGIREAATGYRDAMVIVNGKYEPGLGGGICQVSSTLYNVALLAGLEIVERHNHALAVAYVPVGRDATVVYGVQDFRFANSTQDPIYIAAHAAQGKLAVAFYGNIANKKSISITNPIDQVIPFQNTEEVDYTLLAGTQKLDHYGVNGYVVRTYRNYLNEDGNVIESEFLARDSYQPLNRLMLVGPPIEEIVAEYENYDLNTELFEYEPQEIFERSEDEPPSRRSRRR